ncbi:MAG: hypothetical protein IJ986_08660 [Bacteroidales bacterium]|nr:hypothetical protein [Bacteroidales bacterium]
MEYIIKVNNLTCLIIAILLSSCKMYSYENICGEYVMDFSNIFFESKWTINLHDSGDFVLTEPGIGLLGPDTLSGEYTIVGNKMILNFGNANRYQYKPELGDTITILHFYNKKTTAPQVCAIDIYKQFGEWNFTTHVAAETDTVIGLFDSIVCSTFLTDTIVVYPQHIGCEISIYLFKDDIPVSAPYWVLPQWRICSQNKLCDPNRLFVKAKRNIYKRK